MSKLIKILLVLFGIGIILVVVSAAVTGNFSLFADTFENDEDYGDMLTYSLDEEISNIDFDFEDRHVILSYVDDEQLTIEYFEHENDTFTFSAINETLNIEQSYKRLAFSLFSFNFVSREVKTVTVKIPHTWILDDVNIQTKTGDIMMDFDNKVTYQSLYVSNLTGKIIIENVDVFSFDAYATTGDMRLKDIKVEDDTKIEISTGDIDIDAFEAKTIDIDATTGHINISNMISDDADLNSSTGDMSISNSTISHLMMTLSTGKISLDKVTSDIYELETSTGDINISLTTLNDYRFDLSTNTGSIKIDGHKQGDQYQSLTGNIDFTATTSTGNIIIEVDA